MTAAPISASGMRVAGGGGAGATAGGPAAARADRGADATVGVTICATVPVVTGAPAVAGGDAGAGAAVGTAETTAGVTVRVLGGAAVVVGVGVARAALECDDVSESGLWHRTAVRCLCWDLCSSEACFPVVPARAHAAERVSLTLRTVSACTTAGHASSAAAMATPRMPRPAPALCRMRSPQSLMTSA
jgi:hypothetical protein